LDRDGTINRKAQEGDYIKTPDQLELLAGAAQAIRLLNESGFLVFVVTNQRGIARGILREEQLQAIHDRLQSELAAAGARVDGIYYCPHEDGQCDCRKPGIGLHLKAIETFPGIDIQASFCVGDSWRDVEAGIRLGCRVIMIDDGTAGAVVQRYPQVLTARSLEQAAAMILAQDGQNSENTPLRVRLPEDHSEP
jgi:D-glycero-D-manno-heptose 1,7-bisphosphate phosphatase